MNYLALFSLLFLIISCSDSPETPTASNNPAETFDHTGRELGLDLQDGTIDEKKFLSFVKNENANLNFLFETKDKRKTTLLDLAFLHALNTGKFGPFDALLAHGAYPDPLTRRSLLASAISYTNPRFKEKAKRSQLAVKKLLAYGADPSKVYNHGLNKELKTLIGEKKRHIERRPVAWLALRNLPGKWLLKNSDNESHHFLQLRFDVGLNLKLLERKSFLDEELLMSGWAKFDNEQSETPFDLLQRDHELVLTLKDGKNFRVVVMPGRENHLDTLFLAVKNAKKSEVWSHYTRAKRAHPLQKDPKDSPWMTVMQRDAPKNVCQWTESENKNYRIRPVGIHHTYITFEVENLSSNNHLLIRKARSKAQNPEEKTRYVVKGTIVRQHFPSHYQKRHEHFYLPPVSKAQFRMSLSSLLFDGFDFDTGELFARHHAYSLNIEAYNPFTGVYDHANLVWKNLCQVLDRPSTLPDFLKDPNHPLAGEKKLKKLPPFDGKLNVLSTPLVAQKKLGIMRLSPHDFNRDGYSDLLAIDKLGHLSSRLLVYLNDKKGHFTQHSSTAIDNFDLHNRDLHTVDFNGDGLIDVAVYGTNQKTKKNQLIFFEGTAEFTFKRVDNPIHDEIHSWFTCADFDNDGIVDLVQLSTTNRSFNFLKGVGDFTFEKRQALSPGKTWKMPWYIEVMDWDGDGELDVLVGYRYLSALSVFYGDGKGSFSWWPKQNSHIFHPNIRGNLSGIFLGDFDGKNSKDLVATFYHQFEFRSFKTLTQGKDTSFIPFEKAPLQVTLTNYSSKKAIADFNGDKKDDIFISLVETSSIPTTSQFLLSKGDGRFQSLLFSKLFGDERIVSYTTADFDGDKQADLLFLVSKYDKKERKNHYRFILLPNPQIKALLKKGH